jgi:outer membrane immunogenic protein
MNHKLLGTVAAVAIVTAIAGPAMAADLPVKAKPLLPAPAPVVVNWTGLYIGGHVGGGTARFRSILEFTEDVAPTGFNASGWLLGIHAGYNWQLGPTPWGSWLVGLEGDVSAPLGWHKRVIAAGGSETIVQGQLDGLASIRGRLGLVFDRALIYATGGGAWAKTRQIVCTSGARAPTDCNDNKRVKSGGVVGGGIEWRYTPNLSLRFEGLHYIFNESISESATGTSDVVTHGLRNVTVFRVGFSWMFGPGDLLGKSPIGKGPVVARY